MLMRHTPTVRCGAWLFPSYPCRSVHALTGNVGGEGQGVVRRATTIRCFAEERVASMGKV